MTSAMPSFVVFSTLGLAVSAVSEAAGIRLERQGNDHGSTIKAMGKTGQGIISVPAIYSACELVSKFVATKWPELSSTFGGSFAIGLAYTGAIAFSATFVIAPTVLEIAKNHVKSEIKKIEDDWRAANRSDQDQPASDTVNQIYANKVRDKRSLLESIEIIDDAISFVVKAINLIYLVSLAIFSGMSAPIALGIAITSFTILPVVVEKFL